MDYELSDSSGTDDDLPPPHQNRFARNARVAGNGRSAAAPSAPYPRMPSNDMETQIHLIEQEAYFSVLRAFKAQSDAITWEMESLITELRKELRVSDEEHREILARVNSDDMILRIREWRKNGQPGMLNSSQPPHESVPSPTISASRKKQKTGQSVSGLSVGAPSPALHPSTQPSSSNLKRGQPAGGRTKKTKQSMPYPSPALQGRPQVPGRSASGQGGPFVGNDPDNLKKIGKRVWTRWPEDNNFYEAVITDFQEGLHALVYDMHTPNEAWEWVNLKEISADDIRWEGEESVVSHRGGRTGGQGRGVKKSSARGGAVTGAGRGRGTLKGHPKKDLALPQNGIGRKGMGDIELLHTDTLIKEVEKVFSANHPDPTEVEKAKKVLKEHEQALVEAIARLQDASDGESDGLDHTFSQGQTMDREQGWRKRQYDEIGGEGRGMEGLDGDKGRVASEKKQEA